MLLWDYHDVAAPGEAAEVTVRIDGLPAGVHRALLQNFRIDATHSNAYAVWMAMGSPQQPSDEQIVQLKQSAGLQLLASPAWVDVEGGSLTIKTETPRESISLLKLSW